MSTAVRPDVQGSPPPPPGGRHTRLLVALLAVIVLAGAAVAGVLLTRDDSTSSTDEVIADGQRAPKTEEEKIVEAVKNYYRVDDEAFQEPGGPNPNHPLYPVYAAGPQLQAAVDAAAKAKAEGIASRQPANSITEQRVTVVSIDGDRARIRVCSIDDGIIIRSDTGKPAYEYPPGYVVTALYTGEMVREGSAWKIWSLKREQRWEGVTGCAVGQA
ncbi:MAG: hypothetical protein ABR540_14750 [Acidimicrobiales bacterium]